MKSNHKFEKYMSLICFCKSDGQIWLHMIEMILNSNICFPSSNWFSVLANYLEISLSDAETHGEGRARFTDFKLEMRTNMPVFKMKEVSVRRRYSDFKVSRLQIVIITPNLKPTWRDRKSNQLMHDKIQVWVLKTECIFSLRQ